MFLKIKKAIKEPRKIFPYMLFLIKSQLLEQRRSQVKLIELDGRVFCKYRGILYPEFLNQGNAMSFILKKAKQYCQGKGLDIGASQWPLPGSITIQSQEHQNAYKLDYLQMGAYLQYRKPLSDKQWNAYYRI